MSALASSTDIVIKPFVASQFHLAIAALKSGPDESAAYESLAEAVVNEMSRSLSDSDILDIWITEGYPEPGPAEIDPECGVWSCVYAGIAAEIDRMIGATDIAEWLGVEHSLGVGVGSIIVVTEDGWDRRAYHVSERAYGMDDGHVRDLAMRHRPTVPLHDGGAFPDCGIFEVTFVDTDTWSMSLIPVAPEDVPVPLHLR